MSSKNKIKIYTTLQIIFVILTFIGIYLIISSNGQKNAGYALIPMVFSIAFGTSRQREVKK